MSDGEDDTLAAIIALYQTEYDFTRVFPWVRAEAQHFRLELQDDSASEILRAVGQLDGFPQYEAAVQALESDPAIGPSLGRMFGDPLGRGLVEAEQLLRGMILRAVGNNDPMAAIEARLADVRDVLGGPVLIRRVLAPLPHGFHCSVASPVVLDERTHIRQLNDLEIATTLHLGFRFSDMADTWGLVEVGDPWGIEVTHELPVVSKTDEEKIPQDMRDAAVKTQLDANNQAARAVQAMRLTKSGPISVLGQLNVTDDVIGGRSIQFTSRRFPRPPGDSYTLTDADIDRLRTVFHLLGEPAVVTSPSLETAIRRFSSSIDRHDPEDRLIDLIISAEALFAGDASAGDLSLRVAQRFARYVHTAGGPSVMELSQHMKSAYVGRSSIVHAAKRTKRVQNKISFATENAGLTEDLMRTGIFRAISEATDRGDFAVDWDRRVLDGP